MPTGGVTVEIDQVGYVKPSSRNSCGGYELVGVMGEFGSPKSQLVATFYFEDWAKSRHRHSTANCRGERVIVPKQEHLVVLPSQIPPEIAVSLPYRGLMAYRAVEAIKPHLKPGHQYKTAMVIGSHGLGVWTVQAALSLINSAGNLRWVVVDTSSQAEEYILAAYHNNFSTFDLLSWPPNCYEEDLIGKTKRTCPVGVGIVFDFSGSSRTANRMTGFLNDNCVVVTVGETNAWRLPLGGKIASVGSFTECDLALLPELINLLVSGRLRPPKLLPLEKLSVSDVGSDTDSLRDAETPDYVFGA